MKDNSVMQPNQLAIGGDSEKDGTAVSGGKKSRGTGHWTSSRTVKIITFQLDHRSRSFRGEGTSLEKGRVGKKLQPWGYR